MPNETAGLIHQSFLKANRLLPAGATLSAVAGLFESLTAGGAAIEWRRGRTYPSAAED